MSAFNTTALAALLGAYCRDNKEELYTRIVLGLFDDVPWMKNNVAGHGILDRFTFMEGVTDEVPLPRMDVSEIVKPGHQPGDATFTGSPDKIKFAARVLKVRDWSVDLVLDPKYLEKTWLAMNKQLGSWAGKFTKAPAFGNIQPEEFMIKAVIKAAHRDIRMKALFGGVYNAAGNASADIVNGWFKLTADAITAGELAPTVTGAITSANVEDKLLMVYDSLSEEFKADETQMLVNATIFDWYARKNKPTIVKDPGIPGQQPGMGRMYLYGTNCELKREPGAGASQRVICTPVANMVFGMDSRDEYTNVDVEKFERTIKLMMDGKIGLNFRDVGDGTANHRPLAVNDAA
ncbi:hypothetical protein SAMN05660461_5997 [Chitinophaga ginsengisegetis]|uniref:Phage major capsid protein, HK97 family n=1 Tax=Chitinophaga ginsengisegetis TaxID=393003 RepID=A0A1T5PBX6_9BACT|nr:hypothetical protein [Chitinophaga ginsengisegetis]SKD10097.1 hypothetical protein SAMN05660461_5997 [Chitinophaga ginsengisegetis]